MTSLRRDPPPGSQGLPHPIPEPFWVLADELQEGVVLMHGELITWCNRALCELSGYAREDLIGRSWEVLVPAPELATLQRRLLDLLEGRLGFPQDLELDGRRQDGRVVRIAVSVRETTLQGDQTLLVLVRNVNERRRTEERVRMQHDLALALGTATNLTEALRLSAEPTLKLTEMEGLAVIVKRTEGAEWFALEAVGISPEVLRALTRLESEKQIMAQLRRGQTVYTGPEDLRAAAADLDAFAGIAGIALTPLRLEERFVGVLALTSREAAFSAQKRALIETLCAYLSQAILRKLYEAELQESEEKFRTLAEELGEGVVLYMNHAIVWVNQAALKITGYRAVEVIGRDFDVFFPPKEIEIIRRYSQERLSGGPAPDLYQTQVMGKDGTPVDVEIGVRRIALQERPALVAVFQDVTERKRTEDALRASEERFRKIVETAPSMLHITDREGRNIYVSPNSVEVTGYAPEELMGKWVWWVDPEDQPRVWEDVQRSMRERTGGRNYVYKGRRKNGEVWYASASWVPMLENGEVQGLLIQTVDITAWRRSEEQLYLTQFAVDRSNEAVYLIREDGTITYVNDAAYRILGYTREELQRVRVYWDLDPDFNAETWTQHWRRLKDQGHLTFESRHRAKSGQLISVEIQANHLEFQGQAYHCTFVRDIRERKRIETSLRVTQFALDHSPDVVYWLGGEGRVIYANEATCALLGYTREEMLALTVFDLDPSLTRERWLELWQHHQDRDLTFEVTNRTKSGEDIALEVTGYHVIYGEQEFVCSFARDIRERKRREAEERRLQEGLLQTQKLESLGVLAGGIAHDFNNLLMGVLGHASLLLLDLPSDSPLRASLLQIENETRRAADLTNQLLAYSGRGRFLVQPLDLSWLVEDSVGLLKLTLSKRARLACQLEKGLPAVEGEATQLRQVIMNLVINASDALGDQEGVITLRTRLLEAGPEHLSGLYTRSPLAPGRYVVLEVLDTGNGMDEETRRRIFDPFFTTKFTGRGLGLAAVLGIVHGHNGGIQVISAPGRGTTFRIFLPCADAEAQTPVGPKPVAARRGQGTVLVVDDESSVRTVVQIILEEYGFKVLVACDGRQALDLVRGLESPPDAVLLDLTMPGLSGFETFQELRRLYPGTKVVLSSGYTEQESVSQFSGQGLAGFIQKPYHAEALVSKINEVLG